MASGNGYDGAVTPVIAPFTTEQRQRLEAVTFARKLTQNNQLGHHPTVEIWLKLADYIVTGDIT